MRLLFVGGWLHIVLCLGLAAYLGSFTVRQWRRRTPIDLVGLLGALMLVAAAFIAWTVVRQI